MLIHVESIKFFLCVSIPKQYESESTFTAYTEFLLEDISFSFSSVLETEIVYKFDSEFFTAIPIHESVYNEFPLI